MCQEDDHRIERKPGHSVMFHTECGTVWWEPLWNQVWNCPGKSALLQERPRWHPLLLTGCWYEGRPAVGVLRLPDKRGIEVMECNPDTQGPEQSPLWGWEASSAQTASLLIHFPANSSWFYSVWMQTCLHSQCLQSLSGLLEEIQTHPEMHASDWTERVPAGGSSLQWYRRHTHANTQVKGFGFVDTTPPLHHSQGSDSVCVLGGGVYQSSGYWTSAISQSLINLLAAVNVFLPLAGLEWNQQPETQDLQQTAH